MVFLTSNLALSPRSVCDLYPPVGHRGVFHGGHTELAGLRGVADFHAALLLGAHLGVRTPLYAPLRSGAGLLFWKRINFLAQLKSYGTASGQFGVVGAMKDAWLPDLELTRQ
jgi:hypothetical protein